MTTTVIITTSDSSAGCLSQVRPDAKVCSIRHRVVAGPAPHTIVPDDFFEARRSKARAESSRPLADGEEQATPSNSARWAALWETLDSAGDIELWPDPDANGQLLFAQMVSRMAADAEPLPRVRLVQLDKAAGRMTPEELRNCSASRSSSVISNEAVDAAQLVWGAWTATTPEAFASLLTEDLAGLQTLRSAVGRMLEELPSAHTGLSRTQSMLLEFAASPGTGPLQALGQYAQADGAVLNYWEAGQLLMELTQCRTPALAGLDATQFTNELHNDPERLAGLRATSLRRTPYGDLLMQGAADFAAENAISNWWGGTRLTNNALWRWNAMAQHLVQPA